MTREEELKKIEETFAEIRRTGDRSRREEAGKLLKRRHELMMEDPEYRKEQEERARIWDEVYRREDRIQEIKNEIAKIIARGGTKEEALELTKELGELEMQDPEYRMRREMEAEYIGKDLEENAEEYEKLSEWGNKKYEELLKEDDYFRNMSSMMSQN